MNNLLIDNDNSIYKNYCHHHIKFKATDNIDKYISTVIIPQLLLKHDFSTLYIKDTLSSNYLELHGIILAYHIRLSKELKEKRFIPIVILSDTTRDILNKIDPIARILFTKNIYLIPNTTEAIKKFQKRKLETLKENEFNSHFLDLITVAPPENSTSHSIANEWAIERWATLLNLNSSAIENNRDKISSMLYVKYLRYKFNLESSSVSNITKKHLKGKLLFIDDKGKDGWNDIVSQYLDLHYEGMEFRGFEDSDFLDITTIQNKIKDTIEEYEPNIILLDLRLLKEETTDKVNNISGIKILDFIKKEYPSIQIIMFTASSDSLILDSIRDKGVLGYVKKDAPTKRYTTSKTSFKRLDALIKEGMKKEYLQKIYKIQKMIIELEFFNKKEDEISELHQTVKMVFEILNSNMPNNLTYAMFAIFKCLEIITSLYIEEKWKKAYWKNNGELLSYFDLYNNDSLTFSTEEKCFNNTLENKIRIIVWELLEMKEENTHNEIKKIVCMRNSSIHPKKELDERNKCYQYKNESVNVENIIDWFELIQAILLKIDKISR